PQEFLDEAQRGRQMRDMAQDTPLLRALGLAHHWQRLLDEGRFSSMTEIAAAEDIDLGQASKMSRLAQLAPDLIEAIALGRLDVGVSQLLRGRMSASWLAQREALVAASR
ncbi:MAG: LacI family transcriptional regulator, partial [Sterolibacterium sp.]|nr:LacI family transcriptional regulator [Sterolibacterium sp.]